jgi:hypothetical protein
MRLKNCFALAGAAALLATFAGGAGAQRTPPIAPGHPTSSKMGGMMGGHGMRPMMGGGRIVGNKNTKVYHLPGDKGNMPLAKNAVYFRTEREARAAGYHASGTKTGPKNGMSGMHVPMRHPMTGKMNGSHGHLPK